MMQLKSVSTISLCVFLATLALPRQLTAISVVPNEDILADLDQEPDDVIDVEALEGSGHNFDIDELAWVVHTRSGTTLKASLLEIEELRSTISQQKDKIGDDEDIKLAAPAGLSQMEDGPLKLMEEDEKGQRKPFKGSQNEEEEELLGQQHLKEIAMTNFYPEYAIGILENSCTAFMIGPKHALTTANCVYDRHSDSWGENLDFWRGRNVDHYLDKMEWTSVLIPDDFYTAGKLEKNWALIEFETESPVWLRIAHSSKLQDIAMTVYGYLPDDHPYGTMYDTICRSRVLQPRVESLDIQCSTNQKFSGGPVLRGYNFQRSKMPLVYAMSVSYDYSYVHQTVRIHEDLFWSLCYFMKKAGHDLQCGPLEY